jgi:hypothetical protein
MMARKPKLRLDSPDWTPFIKGGVLRQFAERFGNTFGAREMMHALKTGALRRRVGRSLVGRRERENPGEISRAFARGSGLAQAEKASETITVPCIAVVPRRRRDL